jgi:uncharacterized protein (TIGR00661 family)
MKILFGVCGEGIGHVSHASEIAKYLKNKGHGVKIVTYGSGLEFLKNFDIFPVRGLHAVYKNGRVNYPGSIFYNVKNFSKNFFQRKEISKMVDEFKPDVCLTDDEPIVARIAYSRKIPLVSSSMMNTFVYSDEKAPFSKKMYYFVSKGVTKRITPKANKILAISLTNKKYQKGDVLFLPPIIRSSIKNLKIKKGKHILVYVAKSYDELIDRLKGLNESFVIYGVQDRKDEDNLKFKKPETFLKDLAECKAIISTAGFTLISEAIYLKKPLFAVPLRRHYEQYFNARFIKENGFGDFSEKPSLEEINNFLKNINSYKKNFDKVRFNGEGTLKEIAEALESFKRGEGEKY